MISCSVILPAAGRGERFSAGGEASASKIEHELEGRAVFLRAIDLFHGRPEVVQVLLAVDPRRLEEFRFRWGEALSFLGVTVVAGGEQERWETVANALPHVVEGATHIAVHDAARPATPTAVIDRVFTAAEQHGAVIPGLAVSNTLKRLSGDKPARVADHIDDILGLEGGGDGLAGEVLSDVLGLVGEGVSRDGLVEVQTPQVFEAGLLRSAYGRLAGELGGGAGFTDDAGLVEAMGEPVMVVEGDPGNVKLTRPADAALLSALLRYREAETQQAEAVRDLFGDEDE